MSGHSKWANIKHKKGRMDAKRGKIFTKIGREIIVAVKQGKSGDPTGNPRLKVTLQKARANNMPGDNIKKLIQKALGAGDENNYEEFAYEGYGPAGVAVILDIMTDNKNRTAGEIRHLFAKHGGNLGETGCVGWMFETKGEIKIDIEKFDGDLDDLMLLAIDVGAEDVDTEDEVIVYSEIDNFEEVKKSLEENNVPIISSQLTRIPQNTVSIDDMNQAKKVLQLVDLLEDNDDVQNVYSNFDISDDILEQME